MTVLSPTDILESVGTANLLMPSTPAKVGGGGVADNCRQWPGVMDFAAEADFATIRVMNYIAKG